MSEHKLNSHEKIYSDFAYRLGVIVQQYDELQIKGQEKYETTLYVCVLQNLLTQFDELRKWVEKETKNGNDHKIETVWDKDLAIWNIDSSFVKVFEKGKTLNIGYVLDKIRDILSHPLPVSDGLKYESISKDGEITQYNFYSKDHGKDIFSMELPYSNLKDLVLKLSKYLSEVAKKVTKTVNANYQSKEQDVVIPLSGEDPILRLGKNPVSDEITDASISHDEYIYGK